MPNRMSSIEIAHSITKAKELSRTASSVAGAIAEFSAFEHLQFPSVTTSYGQVGGGRESQLVIVWRPSL